MARALGNATTVCFVFATELLEWIAIQAIKCSKWTKNLDQASMRPKSNASIDQKPSRNARRPVKSAADETNR